jgi:cytochrome c oxidase cbb3-type subunit 3
MKMNFNIKNLTLPALLLMVFNNAFGQSTTSPAPASGIETIPENSILFWVSVGLFFIILILSATVNSALELYKAKKIATTSDDSSGLKKVVSLLALIFLSTSLFAQSAPSTTPAADAPFLSGETYRYILITVILIEMAVLVFYIKILRFLTGIEEAKKLAAEQSTVPQKTLWEKINQFQPIENEANFDTGHSYDGIRELDNITPPWFIAGFVATIIFAGAYLYRYHVAKSAPMQIEEYNIEMQAAALEQESLLKSEANKVDENSVVMLGAADITAGKKMFTANCAACHGNEGQGGVGPNLTDAYWLHGGSIKDVFKLVKYGFESKGMRAWKDDFSPMQIAQLASYIKSLEGTNPAGAKEKQGELYTPEAEVVATAVADSSQVK